MDPRQYNYEYRRPRLNNPTYHSLNTYESLYHMGKIGQLYGSNFLKDQYNNRQNIYTHPYLIDNAASSQPYREDNSQKSAKLYLDKEVNTEIRQEDFRKIASSNSILSGKSRSSSKPEIKNVPQRPSVLASYGSRSILRDKSLTQQRDRQQINFKPPQQVTSRIFIKQQKPYDIISCYPRQISQEPLHKFPKLTLENKLYERGIGAVNPENI